MTNTSHTTCACDHLTNFALLMVQKQTPETQFFHAMNENNHLQTAAVTDEDGPEVDSPKAQTQELASLADFKKILLRNYERILSKNWDFLSQREVRELTGREQEQIFEAWKQQGLIDDASNVEKRRAIELIRSEFLRLKNFSRVRKMLVLIKNSLFWKMKRFNSHGSPLRETRQINWRELPKTPLVRDFLRNLIKFRDFLRDGKMDNEKVQNLDLVLTERQENAFIVRFMLLNEAYMRQFMNMTTAGGAGGADSLDHPSRVRSFRALNSFYIQEQLQFLQMMRQQKKEEKVFGSFPDSQLMDEFRKVEKDEWFSIEDIRADEITDHGLLGAGGSGGGLGGHPDGDGNGLEEGYIGSGDDNLFLYQLVRNNTTLRLFIYLSVVLCVVLIVVAIVLLKLYHGSMFKVRRSQQQQGGQAGVGPNSGSLNGMVGSNNDMGLVAYELNGAAAVRASMRCPQQPLPSIPPSSNASSDAPMIELSRGSSLRRSLVMMGGGGTLAETDFSLGGGGRGLDEFQLKRMYNGRASYGAGGAAMTMIDGGGGGSLGLRQKRKRNLATEWPLPPTTMGTTGFDEYPPTILMGAEGELELERRRAPVEQHHQPQSGLVDETLLGLDGRMLGYPPPPIFVNQHHHHLHHHLHTHTHYGPGGVGGVEASMGVVPRQKAGGLYQ